MKSLKGMTLKTRIVRLIVARDKQAAEHGRVLSGAMVELPGQQEGFLSVFKVAGRPQEREELLKTWFEQQTEIEVDVITETVRHGHLSYSVSQWSTIVRQREAEQAERNARLAEINDGDTLAGVIDHIVENKSFAIVNLGGVTGLLHEEEVTGITLPERRKRLREELKPGTEVTVVARNRRTDEDGFVRLYLSERLVLIREEYARLGLDDPAQIIAAAEAKKS